MHVSFYKFCLTQPSRICEDKMDFHDEFQLQIFIVRQHHLFNQSETLCLTSSYHKILYYYSLSTSRQLLKCYIGTMSSGSYKHILWLLPFSLAQIFYILFHIICPLEAALVLGFVILSSEKHNAMHTYHTYIFTTFGY